MAQTTISRARTHTLWHGIIVWLFLNWNNLNVTQTMPIAFEAYSNCLKKVKTLLFREIEQRKKLGDKVAGYLGEYMMRLTNAIQWNLQRKCITEIFAHHVAETWWTKNTRTKSATRNKLKSEKIKYFTNLWAARVVRYVMRLSCYGRNYFAWHRRAYT